MNYQSEPASYEQAVNFQVEHPDMHLSPAIGEQATSPPGPRGTPALVRLGLALVLTFALLIYAWGRSLIEGMINGRPGTLYVALLGVGIAVVIGLTAGLSSQLKSPILNRRVLYGVPALWILITGTLIWMFTGRLLPKAVVVPLFTLASLWVLWLAWMFYRPWPWKTRIGGLVICGLFPAAFLALLRVEGVLGEFQVEFTWRNAPIVDHGAELPKAVSPATGDRPDLSQTTPDDWPQFLGPARSAIANGPRLDPDWERHPPREMWRKPVGAGWSSFAIVGDYAVTQEQRGNDECVVCYRLADGHVEWVHSDAARFDSNMGGSGPRATPTIAGGRVYAVGGTGILNCLEGSTGEAVWSINILNDNGGNNIAHGVCGSPLVVDGRVIVAPTGIESGCLAAYRRDSGERVWRGGRHQASYGSPALVELRGSRQVLLVTRDGIEGSDLESGQPLWSYSWSSDLHVNCSQPVIVDQEAGRVLFSTGYGVGSVLLEVAPGSDGTWRVAEIWKSPGKLKTKFTTAVLHNGFVYGLDEGILACLDAATGKQMWKKGRYQHGQILLADDLLIVQAEAGDVYLVRPDPKELIELGSIPALSAKTWNNPALAGRHLLVRNDREAVCYELPIRTGTATAQ